VATDYLLEYAREVDRPEAGALFICCGALRALDIGDRPSTSRSS
jgi:hypothetical protein